MLHARIGLASKSGSVDLPSLTKVASALSVQIARDLAPIWGCTGTVSVVADPDSIEPGIWPVYIVDDIGADAAGYHQTDHNQPYALVQAGDTWSLTASHEVLEMLVDPSGNRLVASNAVAVIDNEVRDCPGKFEYLVEVADPSEDETSAYLIDDVLVADFYTPHYFDTTASVGVRYSFKGRIRRPREVLPNGYLSWFNPSSGHMQQARAFGAPVIVDLPGGEPGSGSLTGGRSLRSFVDHYTRPPLRLSQIGKKSSAVVQLDLRRTQLTQASLGRATLFEQSAEQRIHAAEARTAAAAKVPPARVLKRHLSEFGRKGVVSVRSGRLMQSGQVTDLPAIVVNVRPESVDTLAGALPKNIDGVPVDVRPAGVMKQMRVDDLPRYMALGAARHELRDPEFADETFFDKNGKPIGPSTVSALAAARPRKEEIQYTPAAGVSLDEVTEDISLVLHVSPDAGLGQLTDFLSGVQHELVVGMYDFTSAKILQAVEAAMAGKSLTLTLDHPPKNPSADQTGEQTIQDLSQSLGGTFKSAWALTNPDKFAPVWIYPNAYHIKVAVRDESSFWLSSGNWNNSNQPEIDISDPSTANKVAETHDRDWHVIATGSSLPGVFRAFLENDYGVAHAKESETVANAALAAAAQMPELVVPAAVLAAGRVPRQFFAPKTISGQIRIQPLLTPDNYHDHVLALIQSAKQKFYMQTQYIHPSGRAGDEDHDALIAAVAKLVQAGLDVRLICSEFETPDWVEKVADAGGIEPSVLRIQPKVHNKGIIVDGAVAMISSQNWSADGTLRNRDAGLIIWDARAAAYFEEIFLHDWNFLASPSHPKLAAPQSGAAPGDVPPATPARKKPKPRSGRASSAPPRRGRPAR
ncbi:MAG: hypothetical protein JO163_13160 [Methylobacteriaceae bacterium]|nr:hypothetical protein [Methylobacteriaceae bacterium]